MSKNLLITVASALLVFVILLFAQSNISNHVTLAAMPWNDGVVHVWHSIEEVRGAETPFTDVADGTRCQRLDKQTHKLIGDPPPIYYYYLDCNGVVGYVEVDQVR